MEKQCEVCGVTFNAVKSRIRACSRRCADALRSVVWVERTCPVCGIAYLAHPTRLRFGRQTTCSRDCSYKLRGDNVSTAVILHCTLCQREFTRSACCVKGKHGSQFCSPACHYAGRSLGLTKRIITKPYQYTEASLASLSKAGAHAIASGNLRTASKHEDAVADALTRCGIPFLRQQVFEADSFGICVDFLCPSLSCVIEVDGPHHRNKAAVTGDRERDEFLRSLGFRVIRATHTCSTIPEEVARTVLIALAD